MVQGAPALGGLMKKLFLAKKLVQVSWVARLFITNRHTTMKQSTATINITGSQSRVDLYYGGYLNITSLSSDLLISSARDNNNYNNYIYNIYNYNYVEYNYIIIYIYTIYNYNHCGPGYTCIRRGLLKKSEGGDLVWS